MHAKPRDVSLPFRLRKLIQELHPTIIHVRNWGAWPDVACARLLTCPAVPLIFSFHGLEHPGPPARHIRLAFRILSQMTTHLFTVSQATRRMLIEQIGLPPHRIAVIPNGVDVNALSPARKRQRTGTLVVGSTGGLKPVKNHDLLVRACATAADAALDLELHIAGEGAERTRIEQTAKELGFENRLHLLGRIDNVPEFLNGLDIFVLPSNSEAHPNALLEAMACGLPCIGTAVGGIPETLEFGQTGLVVPPRDRSGLANAILFLAKDDALRQRLGSAARERACSVYSLQEMLRSYDRLYRRVASERAAGALIKDALQPPTLDNCR
jgi:glycosyltransferase involved in cell wall biosynthesis